MGRAGAAATTLLPGNERYWCPVEDEAAAMAPGAVYPQPQEPTWITIGRGCTMQVYSCDRSFAHTRSR
ncbi:hypothetical protein OH786_32510 [Streptomyces atratus]|uniref:hypothetical protein n=1 Tax=Streptomyces atratus TaxID=1893 RepID=UPI00324E5ABC